MTAQLAAPKPPQFEAFKCYGTPDKRHGPRMLVEVDWERRLIHKKCDECKQWHTLVSERG